MGLKEYSTSLPDGTMLRWRPLKWGEYRKLINQFDGYEKAATWLLYDAIAAFCLVDFQSPCSRDGDLDDLPAGTIQCLGELILQETGFVPEKDLVLKHLDKARERVSRDYYTSAVGIICVAFRYRPEEVANLTLEEFMDLLVMAEQTLKANLSIADPNQEEPQPMVEMPNPHGPGTIKIPLNTAKSLKRKNRIPIDVPRS